MRERRIADVATLRCMLAAIDDVEAVPAGSRHDKYEVGKFGDPSTEVPRKTLSDHDLQDLLQREIAARTEASPRFEEAGRHERAASLPTEAEVFKNYCD